MQYFTRGIHLLWIECFIKSDFKRCLSDWTLVKIISQKTFCAFKLNIHHCIIICNQTKYNTIQHYREKRIFVATTVGVSWNVRQQRVSKLFAWLNLNLALVDGQFISLNRHHRNATFCVYIIMLITYI